MKLVEVSEHYGFTSALLGHYNEHEYIWVGLFG